MREYTFSVGYPFFYWDFYKNKGKQYMENQGFDYNINDLCGYSPAELIIAPKYRHLKDEIINNI